MNRKQRDANRQTARMARHLLHGSSHRFTAMAGGGSMSKYLLSLADLHAAAPGVLGVVFGPDGHHANAPMWRASVGPSEGATIRDAALDLCVPSVAAIS